VAEALDERPMERPRPSLLSDAGITSRRLRAFVVDAPLTLPQAALEATARPCL
jgi:hypothetical protein